jgi:hypothetical protein
VVDMAEGLEVAELQRLTGVPLKFPETAKT